MKSSGRSHLIGAALWVAACVSTCGVAAAASAPDSARLADLQSACNAAEQVRLVSARGIFVLKRPSLDENGVGIAGLRGRAALFTIGAVPEPDRRIPWTDVERLDSERPHAWRGALIGLAVGAAAGTLLYARTGPDAFEDGDGAMIRISGLLAMVGLTGGLLVGLAVPSTQHLYP